MEVVWRRLWQPQRQLQGASRCTSMAMPRLRQRASSRDDGGGQASLGGGGGEEDGGSISLAEAKRAAVSPSRMTVPSRFTSRLAVLRATPRAREMAPAGDLAAMWMW
jgi:hypothetical protein